MNPAPPFAIAVCGIEELAGHNMLGATHVLSILDPEHPVPEAFGTFGEHAKLELRFHDIVDPRPGEIVPDRAHVDAILAFGRTLQTEQASLLVHCQRRARARGPGRPGGGALPCRRVAARTSCSVLVTDGPHVLLGHATALVHGCSGSLTLVGQVYSCHAIQAQRRTPPPHSAGALPGHELAILRGGTASAG